MLHFNIFISGKLLTYLSLLHMCVFERFMLPLSLSLESRVFSYITIFAFSVLKETLIVKGEIERKVEEPARALALRT